MTTTPTATAPTSGRSARRTIAIAATLAATTLVALMLGLDRVLLANGQPTVEVFDDFFRVAVGLVHGGVLTAFRSTRHVGTGIVLGVVLGAAALSVGFFVAAVSSGSLA